MKRYFAEVAATGIAFACALSNHAGACWLWRRLMWLDNWADGVMGDEGMAPSRGWIRFSQFRLGNNAQGGTWRYDHHTRRVERI